MAIVFAPFILILALNNGRITKLFSHPFLIFLGEISFSIYILQFPIGLIVNYINKILKITQPELLFYGFVVSLIGASCISYYMVEVPARNWIKNLYEKRKVKATSIS
jgi:peptidoglycan/LPS O-acetylase OafA/YrhL